MKNVYLECTHIPFLISAVLLFLLHDSVSSSQGDVCGAMDCGEGTCVANNGSLLGFDCVCYSGWKHYQLGPILFPACTVPNCTINMLCGNNAPSPLSAPPPELPPFNLSSPCNLVWCGDGNCVVNGSSHYCECYQGSTNLQNLTALPCIKPCSLGADCVALGFGAPVTTPPPPDRASQLPPPPIGEISPPSMLLPPPPPPSTNGENNVSRCSRSSYNMSTRLLAAILVVILPSLFS